MGLPAHLPAEDRYLIELLAKLEEYRPPQDDGCSEGSPLRNALDTARSVFGTKS